MMEERKKMPKELAIRPTVLEDEKQLIQWLNDEEILHWFPMENAAEIADAARICMSYVPRRSSLTATWEGIPCGLANLYLSSYVKLSHQCLFVIVISKEYRGKGIGTFLLLELMKLAKEKFGIELLHLEVYAGNPAQKLYERLGFVSYGVHRKFLKEKDGTYRDKILMQKRL